jgi:cytoskeletal protein RodZ
LQNKTKIQNAKIENKLKNTKIEKKKKKKKKKKKIKKKKKKKKIKKKKKKKGERMKMLISIGKLVIWFFIIITKKNSRFENHHGNSHINWRVFFQCVHYTNIVQGR